MRSLLRLDEVQGILLSRKCAVLYRSGRANFLARPVDERETLEGISAGANRNCACVLRLWPCLLGRANNALILLHIDRQDRVLREGVDDSWIPLKASARLQGC
jgi:hypothetical protein